MKAHEVMARKVVTAHPGMSIAQIADLLISNRISAVPVVTGDNDVIGIITESDLLHRAETGTEHKRKWWLELFLDPDTQAREFIKSHAGKATDVMSRVVISASEDADLGEVARILDTHGIRRVPVVRAGKLVGIISRSDLVRALALTAIKPSREKSDDATLNKAIHEAIHEQPWINSLYMTFTVSDGTVELIGFVDSHDQRHALRVLVEGVDGVKSVDDRLKLRTWQTAA
jgi:CBS domain-containing protein